MFMFFVFKSMCFICATTLSEWIPQRCPDLPHTDMKGLINSEIVLAKTAEKIKGLIQI